MYVTAPPGRTPPLQASASRPVQRFHNTSAQVFRVNEQEVTLPGGIRLQEEATPKDGDLGGGTHRGRDAQPAAPHPPSHSAPAPGLGSCALVVPAASGASRRPGRDSPSPALTQRGKRAAAASSFRAPGLLTCILSQNLRPGRMRRHRPSPRFPARAQLTPAPSPSRLWPRPPGVSWAEPGKEARPLRASSQKTGAEAVRTRETGPAYRQVGEVKLT